MEHKSSVFGRVSMNAYATMLALILMLLVGCNGHSKRLGWESLGASAANPRSVRNAANSRLSWEAYARYHDWPGYRREYYRGRGYLLALSFEQAAEMFRDTLDREPVREPLSDMLLGYAMEQNRWEGIGKKEVYDLLGSPVLGSAFADNVWEYHGKSLHTVDAAPQYFIIFDDAGLLRFVQPGPETDGWSWLFWVEMERFNCNPSNK